METKNLNIKYCVGLGEILFDVLPTGSVQVQLDKEGVPTYDIKQGVAWDNIPFTDDIKEIAANAGAVCWGSLAQRSEVSRKTIYTFLDHTPEDCLKIFDINLRQNFYTPEVIGYREQVLVDSRQV